MILSLRMRHLSRIPFRQSENVENKHFIYFPLPVNPLVIPLYDSYAHFLKPQNKSEGNRQRYSSLFEENIEGGDAFGCNVTNVGTSELQHDDPFRTASSSIHVNFYNSTVHDGQIRVRAVPSSTVFNSIEPNTTVNAWAARSVENMERQEMRTVCLDDSLDGECVDTQEVDMKGESIEADEYNLPSFSEEECNQSAIHGSVEGWDYDNTPGFIYTLSSQESSFDNESEQEVPSTNYIDFNDEQEYHKLVPYSDEIDAITDSSILSENDDHNDNAGSKYVSSSQGSIVLNDQDVCGISRELKTFDDKPKYIYTSDEVSAVNRSEEDGFLLGYADFREMPEYVHSSLSYGSSIDDSDEFRNLTDLEHQSEVTGNNDLLLPHELYRHFSERQSTSSACWSRSTASSKSSDEDKGTSPSHTHNASIYAIPAAGAGNLQSLLWANPMNKPETASQSGDESERIGAIRSPWGNNLQNFDGLDSSSCCSQSFHHEVGSSTSSSSGCVSSLTGSMSHESLCSLAS